VADPATYRPRPGEIPVGPGVYKFRDAHRRVIYVGKAKSLRPRLSSYFQDIAALHPRTQTMVTSAASVEWTVVSTEVEALQLEYSWIKEYDPRFNVKYRDDKSYPWLAVTLDEEFPRVMVGRGPKRKGVRYFGPYSHAWAIRETGRPAAAGVPHALLLQRRLHPLAADRAAVPAGLHRQVRRTVRRQGRRGRAPGDRRRLL
jgi:excinuclease ABC subunit C